MQYQTTDLSVLRGVIDIYAEMWILAQSSCFIVSNSMFSFGAYYMRDLMKKKCFVFIEKCEDWEHVMGHFDYYGEAIYHRGFVLIEEMKREERYEREAEANLLITVTNDNIR